MARDQRGTKRVCRSCGARFYDLNKTPIVCPACETVYQIVTAPARRTPERAAAKAARPPVPVDEPVVEDADVVSLEEVEEPADDAIDEEDEVVVLEDDKDDEEEVVGSDDDDVFLEPEDDEEGDVSDIVGDVDDERDR